MRERKPRPAHYPLPTIVVVDDDVPLARAWTKWLTSAFPEFRVVTTHTLDDARLAIRQEPILGVVLDVHLGAANGFDLLREMRAAGNNADVLVVTGDERREHVNEATAHRAHVLFKGGLLDEIRSFVAMSIERPRTRRLAATLVAMESKLTTREAQLLFAITDGESNEAIADDLEITGRTVHAHLGALYERLDVESTREAVVQLVNARMEGRSHCKLAS